MAEWIVEAETLEDLENGFYAIGNNGKPVVHCKDCTHWHDPDENKWGDCYEWGGYSEENEYCSWGERKDEVEE